MKTLRYAALALAVSGVFTLGAKAEVETTYPWWNITFDDALGAYMPDHPEEAMVVLTNQYSESPKVLQPWSEGYWTTGESDETTVTNSYFPTNTFKAFGQDTCIKLDTQGDDLTWWTEPTNSVALMENMRTLVDADLYLVGSDSAPDAGDFDKSKDVQTAIYLMNETDEEGLTTNSVLCVYVRDAEGSNYWQELKGVKLYDNDWAHVQVIVDHSLGTPVVRVFVNNVQMTARDGDAGSWTVANLPTAQAAKKVSSISFRGTGAVDNFVGQVVKTTYETYNFTAQVLMDGTNVLTTGDAGNVTRTVPAEAGEGKFATFAAFEFHDQHWDDTAWNEEDQDYTGDYVVSYALTKIEIVDLVHNTTQTFNYGYNKKDGVIVPETESPYIVFDKDTATDDEGKEYEYYSGPFSITAPTAGATANETIVKVYFKTIGLCDAKAVTVDVGGDTTTDVTSLKPTDYPTNLVWKFPASKPGYVLSTIQTAADVDYANGYATVSTNNLQMLTADTTFVTATYVPGTLADGNELRFSREGDTYTFEQYTPPVAIIVASNVTNEYPSLRAAIEVANTNATPVTITLVADDHVSFSVDDPVVNITNAVTIVGGSNKVYGVSAYDFSNLEIRHAFRVTGSGNVVIKDLTLTEFGGSAPTVQYYTYPIWTLLDYTGTITLDNVTVEKFARTAFNFIGGSFEVKNCTIDGYGDDPGCPATFFQDGIDVYDATGWVSNTVMTGLGSAKTDESASFFLMHDGSITVYDGTYGSDYAVGFSTAYGSPTGTVDIRGGSFVTGKAGATSNFMGDTNNVTVTISGGWFTLEPEEGFLAKGYEAVEAAPGTDTPWTLVLANAIWIGGASGAWDVEANWDIGCLPTTTTVVTFTNDAQVGISPSTCKCKEMVLVNANVGIGLADSSKGADLNFYKNAGDAVSGTGTLSLNTVGMFNQNNSGVLTICSGLSILGDVTFKGVKDDNQHAGSWTITNDTTIADGVTVKSIDDAITTFKGNIDIASGATVTFFAAYGAKEDYHGGEIVVDSSSTVTLAHHEGNPATKLVLETRNKGKITINGEVVTDSADYYVKATSTTYEALPKPTVYVMVNDANVTNVTGVTNGQLVTPGDSLTIGVDVAEGYEPSVTIRNAADTSVILLTTNAASFVYTMPEYGINVTPTAVLKKFDITFKPENSDQDIVTNVAYNATDYIPAAPSLAGFTFLGWTNVLDATDTTLYTANPMPAATNNATYAAKWEANAVVEPIPVTIGGDAVNALPAGTAPITIVNSGDTHTFTLRFAAKQVGVTYVLQASTTVNGQFADVVNGDNPVAVTPQAIDEVVELTDPNATQNAKFYRVKVVVE